MNEVAKKKATINGVDSMVISGRAYIDPYGRVDSVSQPATEALGNELNFTPHNPVSITITALDELDRPVLQTMPDNTTIQYEYGFGADAFGTTCFSTEITDPNNNITTQYTNARGLKTTVIAPYSITTSFEYGPLGELLMSMDPESNQTSYLYDMLGRLTSRVHPDAGTTSYTYDLAGNVLTTQTENLQNNNEYIQYHYDSLRLDYIEYPQNPEMNVYYEYGCKNTGNQSGRLVKMQDASGVQTFTYGNMGELIENNHTFVVPVTSGENYMFRTKWKYDSWNRIDSIVYPDGEILTYSYDNGGKLIEMHGVKNNYTYA
ncbi:MAG: RHS repeat protein, partial [Bacteroidales bacterium]|nr:RHS repeat protein [Bacteroidales bacterium]